MTISVPKKAKDEAIEALAQRAYRNYDAACAVDDGLEKIMSVVLPKYPNYELSRTDPKTYNELQKVRDAAEKEFDSSTIKLDVMIAAAQKVIVLLREDRAKIIQKQAERAARAAGKETKRKKASAAIKKVTAKRGG